MSSANSLPLRTRQVPNAESDLDSPTSPSTNPYPHLDDDVASNYESSAEDTKAPPAPHSLLIDDPFSTDISKILFESIGTLLHRSFMLKASANQVESDQLRKNGASKDLDLPQV